MLAATWPTSSLLPPRTVMRDGLGTSKVMPAGDHVGHQRPGEAVQSPVLALVAGTGDDEGVALPGHGDVGNQLALEGALGAGHDHVGPVEPHIDSGGDRDGLAT